MAKTVKRCLIPCAVWDMERLECWLEDMALKGWYLKQDGIFAGFATFEKVKERKVRYRLEITPSKRGLFADCADTPDDEALQISESMGWQFVASHWQYYIYRCEDPSASELNTDPELQALSINALKKREFSSIVIMLFWMCIYPLLKSWGETLRMVLSLGTPLSAMILLFIIWEAAAALIKYFHLKKLRKKLASGGSFDRTIDWRRGHLIKRILRNFSWMLLAAIIITALARWSNEQTNYVSVDAQNIPFALIEDIYPDAEVQYVDSVIESQVREHSDLLAKRMISLKTWYEGDLNGEKFDGFIIASYYEMRSEALAKSLYAEIRNSTHRARHYTELEYPELETDEEFYYIDISPTLILRNDNKVLKVTFSNYGGFEDSEHWLKTFAESIK